MPLFATLGLTALPLLFAAAGPATDDVGELRKSLRHAEAIELLQAVVEGGDTSAAARLAEVSLEAALIGRLGEGPPSKPMDLVTALSALELSAGESVSLARLAFLHGLTEPGQAALGRARDLDPQTKTVTDEVLAAALGQRVPRGGYFRYRGLWLPLADRDRERLFDLALESLWAVAPDRETFRMEPRSDAPNRALFGERWKTGGNAFLRRRAEEARGSLTADYTRVRSLLTSYTAEKIRDRLLETFEVMREPRKEALALIARYEKPQQPAVDAFREQLTALHGAYAHLMRRDWRAVDTLDPVEAFAMLERVRAREDMLGHVDRYLAAYDGRGLGPAAIVPPQHAGTSRGHVLPGREQSGLEDVLWLVLHHAADQHQDVLVRAAELSRNAKDLTPWERLVVRHVRERTILAHNALVATSLDAQERGCCAALDAYRTVLGLEPLEIEERLVAASRKHSQEMVDLGYFGHISPVERTKSPTDRVRLEGFAGGVGENCLAGGASGKAAFEGWYHSPGHHRNLVSAGPQIGVGAASGRMWTMVVGGPDHAWRNLHRDLPPARRAAIEEKVEKVIGALIEERPAAKLLERLAEDMPDALPSLANRAFAAAGAGGAPLARAAPELLSAVIAADVPLGWRPLQVAAVAAAIDVMDTSNVKAAREACFAAVRPLVTETHGYEPLAERGARRKAIAKLRTEWEDVAQLHFIPGGIAAVPEQPLVPGRKGDGPSTRAALRALTKKDRKKLARKHGGGTHTENAVERGLAWLADAQDEDGGWRARAFALNLEGTEGFEGQLGLGNAEWEIGMTGFALLAFCSAGHTTDQGDYQSAIQAGARFLMERVVDYGRFETSSSHYMYSHAIATQALCELYAYSDDPILGVYAQETLDFLIYAQDEKTGGWRYEANQAGDTSVTGWVVMALNAGYKAGLDVAGFREGLRFIDSVTTNGYYEVMYMPGRNNQTNRLGSIGALCRLFMNAKVRDPRVLWVGRRMLNQLPVAGKEDYYYWYYGSLVMFQLGDAFWDEWNAALVPALLEVQNKDKRSPLAGSWPKRGEFSGQGGRVMQTALAVLMLTTYYRYDRDHDVAWHPVSGNVTELAAPYLDIVLGDADASTRAITEAKLLDSLGSSLAPELIRRLRAEAKPGEKGLSTPQRVHLARLLVRVASERHEVVLLDMIAKETEDGVRNQLAHALEVVCSARSTKRLAGELDSDNRTVRLLAARTLGRLGVGSAAAPLSARLALEKDGGVKAEIERALQAITNPSAVVRIVDAALAQDDARRIATLEGLSVLSRAELAREIAAEAEHDTKLYAQFLDTIREHGGEAGVPLLVKALESQRLELRAAAIKLLAALTGKSHGFDANGPADARRAALRRWAEWVEELVAE